MTHPAADLLRAIADGKQMEQYYPSIQLWEKCKGGAALIRIADGEADRIRIAREMVTRTVTYPAPLKEKPEKGTDYYSASPRIGVVDYKWGNNEYDNACFNAGMAFATREDAEAAHKALFGSNV